MPRETPRVAWVVSWAGGTRAFTREDDARAFAVALEAADFAHLSIDQAPDLREAEVYPAFVAHFDGELAPGTVRAMRSEGAAVEVHVDPAALIRTDMGARTARQIRLFVRVDRWVGSAASENVSDAYVAGQG